MTVQTPISAADDLTVIEAGSLLAGAYCGQLLADFGARVIKLEPPGRVRDPLRQWGHVADDGEGLYPSVLHRGKELMTLDLSTRRGKAILEDLLSDADLFIENFRPGTLEKWGLDPNGLIDMNPQLVVIRVSGYGQTGPYSRRPAFGAIAEAMGGLRATTGFKDRPPVRAGVSIGDELAGLFGALGGLLATHARNRGVGGQIVDVAIYESVLAIMEDLLPVYDALGVTKEPSGTGFDRAAPSNIYATSDGAWILVAAPTDRMFNMLARALSMPDLPTNAHFGNQAERARHKTEIDKIVQEWCSQRTATQALEILVENDVPCGRVNTASDIFLDPHIQEREMILEMQDSRFGTLKMHGVVPKLSKTPGAVRHAGRDRGHDTRKILAERGYTASEMEALYRDKIV